MQGRQATNLLSLSQGCLGAVQLPPGERQLRPAIPRSSSLPGRQGRPVLSFLQGPDVLALGKPTPGMVPITNVA